MGGVTDVVKNVVLVVFEVGGNVGGVTDGVKNVVLVVEEVSVTPTVVIRSEEKRILNLYDMNRMCTFD